MCVYLLQSDKLCKNLTTDLCQIWSGLVTVCTQKYEPLSTVLWLDWIWATTQLNLVGLVVSISSLEQRKEMKHDTFSWLHGRGLTIPQRHKIVFVVRQKISVLILINTLKKISSLC